MELPLAVTLYQLSVFVHVSAAIVAFGPTFIFPIIQMTAEKAFPRQLPFAWTVIGKIDRGVVTPVAVIIGLTGIYQWQKGNWDIGHEKWLSTGFTLYLVAFVVALVVFRRAEHGAVAASEKMIADAGPTGEVALSDEYRQATKLANIVGPILGLTVLVITYLMVIKPF